MTTAIRLLLIGFVLILLLGLGAWWYLFGPNSVLAAELVPGDTVAFLTIPNAAQLAKGYQGSQLKKLLDSPDAQPAINAALDWVGPKNTELIRTLLPNLSGQSFIAITHFDPNHPEKMGFIAGMKPKLGTNNFNAFVEKLKATYPDVLKQGTTGTGNVAGVDYQWIQGPGAPDKICVGKLKGWIVTTWGEASLKDCAERLQKQSSTPSLAQNAEYQQSLQRVGKNPATLVYVNSHVLAPLLDDTMHRLPLTGDYLEKKIDTMGGIAVGSGFEQGEIVDRFSFLVPPAGQPEVGMTPCAFDTLKFTGPDTHFYTAFNIDWKGDWKSLQEQQNASPLVQAWISFLKTWAQDEKIDFQHNVIDALGSEFSVQVDWDADTTYPEIGLFAKVNKPADFKPAINAMLDWVRKTYSNTALIDEIALEDHHYASVKFIQSSPFVPTITEDGDYFGFFLSQNQAVRSFKRDGNAGLSQNPDFLRQIGDKRNGASQIVFLNSPKFLDRGYRTALPYVSLASMFNKSLAAALNGRQLPPDLAWLAPIGTWSFVTTTDANGMQSYSASGIGNQGVLLAAGLGGTAVMLQSAGFFHPPAPPAPAPPPSLPSPAPALPDASASTNMPAGTPPPAPSDAAPSSNAAPAATPPPADTMTNASPSSNATPATPAAPPQ